MIQNSMIKLLILFLFIGFHISLQAQVEDVKWEDLKINFTEKEPAFIGGTEEMYRFIYKNIRSTAPCQQESANTKVEVQFAVLTTGYVTNLKVISDKKNGCNDEALRVVSLMKGGVPCWNPGEHNGKKESMTFTLPIMFNIK
ncbi:MAG: energy transducer TonB [Saprospiraceae bacterium]|uniref:Energy transducer TonB n=1 Tax=Candidatus Opimibacter skivensis TaxID=2982028 RepID=A0A9D7SZE4_9BACT|nr:energy transducer TonB [Candidatus Opimibacter skivensis]